MSLSLSRVEHSGTSRTNRVTNYAPITNPLPPHPNTLGPTYSGLFFGVGCPLDVYYGLRCVPVGLCMGWGGVGSSPSTVSPPIFLYPLTLKSVHVHPQGPWWFTVVGFFTLCASHYKETVFGRSVGSSTPGQSLNDYWKRQSSPDLLVRGPEVRLRFGLGLKNPRCDLSPSSAVYAQDRPKIPVPARHKSRHSYSPDPEDLSRTS